MDGEIGQGSDGLIDGSHAAEEDVRAVAIGCEAEFASQFAEPLHSGRGPPGPFAATRISARVVART